MNVDRYLLLTWKKALLFVGAWFLAMLLHNAVYAAFHEEFTRTGGDEAFFFVLAVLVIPLYFVVALVYTTLRKIRG